MPRKKKPVPASTVSRQITEETRGDPLRMPHKLGRPKETTAIHGLPEAIRVEMDSLLASNIPVPAVAAWLSRQPGMVDARGKLLIDEDQIAYYRKNYITRYRIAGGKLVSRFMRSLGVNVDPLLALQRTVLIQVARVQLQLALEGQGDNALTQTGEELDRLDRLLARMFRFKQELGILPRVPQQVEAKVATHGTLATLQMTPGTPVTPEEVRLYRDALIRGFTEFATEAAAKEIEEKKAEEDLTPSHEEHKEEKEAEKKAEADGGGGTPEGATTSPKDGEAGQPDGKVDDGKVRGGEPGAAAPKSHGVGSGKKAKHP